MEIKYPEIGICGLSCRLCPSFHTVGESKCGGCKSETRMQAGCPFITCAIKKRGIEFCWQCNESAACEKWQSHRNFSRDYDTFVCYQKLEENIAYVENEGIDAFEQAQLARERLLAEMLADFNEGRSKRYYCIAAAVFEIQELETALKLPKQDAGNLSIKDRSKVLHAILDNIASEKDYCLRLRTQISDR
jgi:hypothetical protein